MILNNSEIIKNILKVEDTTYLVHNYHPYAAKFIPQLPRFLIEQFTDKYAVVLDPFCGSGTAIVESLLLDRNGIGIEINPIGAIVSKVKTTPLKDKQIQDINSFLKEINHMKNLFSAKSYVGNLFKKYVFNEEESSIKDLTDTLNFPNKYHWFKKDVLNAVLHIKSRIDVIEDKDIKDFLLVALSSIIVRVSNQESETRYAAIDKKVNQLDVFILFENKVKDMLRRMKEFSSLISEKVCAKIFQKDSRFIDFIQPHSVDFIVTSPPYPNTYDYYLYHKLRMIVLGFDYRDSQEKEIGSRHRHSSKNEDINAYIYSMKQCFLNFSIILKPEHYLAIVVGDSVIRGVKYDGFDLIKNIAVSTGFRLVEYICYDLDNISRLFNKSFGIKGKKEYIIIFKNCKEGI